MNKSTVMKVAIPVVIVLLVVGIWFLKNAEEVWGTNPDSDESNQTSPNTAAVSSPAVDADDPSWELLVTEPLDLEKLKSYGIPIIIDFGADSCIPCKEMAPVLEELNSSLRGKAIIRFVDVWKNGDLANGFPIQLIPTQIFIDKDGKPYQPSEAFATSMMMYQDKETSEHVFTAHQGGLTKDEFHIILLEMGMLDD